MLITASRAPDRAPVVGTAEGAVDARPSACAPERGGRRGWPIAVVASMVALALGVGAAFSSSLALFRSSAATTGMLGTKAIFPGERVTPAFHVSDASAGNAAVDRSSELGFSADGLTLATSNWAAAFSSARYLDLELNASLPSGLGVSTAAFELGFSSAGGDSTACYYFEVRARSTNAVLGTYGSIGSPIDCVAGTTLTLSSTSIAASIASTDGLNNLRIRVFGRDLAGTSMILDRATVTGTTPYLAYTLHSTRLVDAADTSASTTTWPFALP